MFMKRDELIKEVRRAAKAAGLEFVSVRNVGPHEVFRCGTVQTMIPRHREIGPKMAFEIRKDLEPALGKRWWV